MEQRKCLAIKFGIGNSQLIIQVADLSTSRSTHVHHAVTLLLRFGNVGHFKLPTYNAETPIARDAPANTVEHRQLGREGKEEKDHRHWTYAAHEGRPSQIQEWLPDRCTKAFKGTC